MDTTQSEWEPIFKAVFGNVVLDALFTGAVVEKKIERVTAPITVPPRAQVQSNKPAYNTFARNDYGRRSSVFKPFAHEQSIDISDEATWKKAHMLLRSIPGTITEITQKN